MEIIRDFNIFTKKIKNKLSRLVNPWRPPRPGDKTRFFRRSHQIENTNSQTLGPKVLKDTFEAIKLDISKMDGQQQTQNHNLTRKEKQALRELTSNNDLVINKADKGSTVVVRHRDDYIQEGLEHLSNTNTYLELNRDYTKDVTKIINQSLQQLKSHGLLSPNMAEYCLPS